jgi:hypothetical protein
MVESGEVDISRILAYPRACSKTNEYGSPRCILKHSPINLINGK